ncbi:hypothetical protein MNBD_NITROSPINAE03-113 [hydrothermal vent metagenome]|uniref:Oxidoreductase molybdopterin-binding domain-containing protein n=1 Tax=hydrothermal vent metagenome TaxID=652676 RepID=A0A3B1CHI5_9ZZZZ
MIGITKRRIHTMTDKPRLPAGQTLTEDFPVLHCGDIPDFDANSWDFRIFGLVKREVALSYEEFLKLPHDRITADFHCVTTWSRFDNIWEGVKSRTVVDLAVLKPEAKFVLIHCEQGYTTNLSLAEFLDDDVIFARKWNGAGLTKEHGFPLRLVVPKLYAWKSAKWVRGIEFLGSDQRGFWERNGYHNHGDPWKEERYSSQEQVE